MERKHEMENGHQFVKDVLKRDKSYRIPKYQRGYRWTETNVEKLLQDVYEDRLYREDEDMQNLNQDSARLIFRDITFKAREGDERDKFLLSIPKNPYCIQPLVVTKPNKNSEIYDVIDGQQRMTTIAIIRAALKKVFGLKEIEAPEIEYESRSGSEDYLKKLYEVENASVSGMPEDDNIDLAYMKQAYGMAVTFYTNCKLENVDCEIQRLYGKYLDAILCENTRFIWYEVPGDDPQKIFANFNTGKIELTNAELIKALFMNPANYHTETLEDRQIVISEKWDEMENQLHNVDFWAFVPHPNQYEDDKKEYGTRIDLLFDFLVMDKWLEKKKNAGETVTVDDYLSYRADNTSDKYIFDEIESWILEKLKKEPGRKNQVMDECWRCVGKIFSNFRELYSKTELYNSIGLYINLKSREPKKVDSYVKDKNTYLEIYWELKDIMEVPRNERLQRVKAKISKIMFKVEDIKREIIEREIKKIKYNDGSNADIVNLLMLYNIAVLSTSQGTGERFNYRENADNKWQREHIFAENVKMDLKDEEREAVLTILSGNTYFDYLEYLFPDDKEIHFTHKDIEYIFDVNKPEENANELVEAKLSYDSNRDSLGELWARAIKAKREAERLVDNRKRCKQIDFILAVEESELKEDEHKEGAPKESELKKGLIRRYVKQFGDEFFKVKNINLENCQSNIEDSIRNAKVCAESKKANIEIDEIGYNFEIDFSKEEVELTEDAWRDWLKEHQEEKQDNYDGVKSNYDRVRDKLQRRYIEELKKQEYNKVEFWEKALRLHKETLERSEGKFFDNDLVKLLKDNHMGNMTLLTGNVVNKSLGKKSAGQNQVVSNKTYKEKKKIIYDCYKNGQFVPLGSLLVFTDIYTQTVNASSLWLPDSRLSYLQDMIDTVIEYLEGDKGKNE